MTQKYLQQILKKVYTQMQIKELLPAEEYQIFVKPKFDGATWRFHQGKHKIVIGGYLVKKMDKNTGEKGQLDYLRSFLYHELAHSIWSQRNIPAIHENLRQECISFELFNLFEDARIEEKMRKHLQHYFRWTQYETLTIPENAIEIFFYILQSECQPEALKTLQASLSLELSTQLYTVFEYYKRVISADKISTLTEIMLEWYKEFPLTDSYLEPFRRNEYLFTLEGLYNRDIKDFEELIQGLEDILDTLNVNKKPSKKQFLDDIESHITTQGEGISLLADREYDYDINIQEEKMIYHKISTLFESKSKYCSSSLPSKRLNIKGLMQKSQRRFKRKEVFTRTVPTITLIVDMSSSMMEILHNMQMILRALNKLASAKIIKCKLILSGTIAGTSQFQVLHLPLEDSIIHKIYPSFSGEGISFTMQSNIQQLRRSDYVWILTDGCITNDEIDKGHFQRLGIKTHAFYIGSDQYQQTMQKYFDFVICQENTEGLIDEILTLIK